MVWSSSGGTDSKNMMSSLMPRAEEEEEQEEGSNKMPPLSSPSSMLLPQHLLQMSSGLPLPLPPEVPNDSSATSGLHDGRESNMPESWSQLLLGGLVGDHERYNAATVLLSKGLEEGPAMPAAAYSFYGHGHGGEEIQTSGINSKSHQVSQTLLASSSPRSCITTSLVSNMLDLSNTTVPAPELKNHHSDNSSEGNSAASDSAPKKARVQTSSSAQSTLKVRKERLGDRITALHQIVSPFGKTDTASVLQETIGYIRFLLSQIEALSFPYLLGHGNGGNSMQQHNLLLNHSTSNGMVEVEGSTKHQEEEVNGVEGGHRKDLRSRGLCLVPVSCTSHLADDNGASDFWAVAAAPPPPPPPLAGIIWR
ncbi:transcription factor bHLH68-like isoform X2 [Miscanthus floridulus]